MALIIGLSVFVFGMYFWRKGPIGTIQPKASSSLSITATPTQAPESSVKLVTINNETYAYGLIRTSAAHVKLIPNYGKRIDFATIFTSAHCTQGTSGGFYDTDYAPLGLVAVDGQIIQPAQPNELFNGYFLVNPDNQASISAELFGGALRIGLQSGPLLIQEGTPTTLHIKNDEHERRIAVTVSKDNSIVFIAVYTAASVFEGPLLSDVPTIVQTIGNMESLTITDALNLDGGSASAFWSNDTKLSELTPVGSLLCIQ